MALINTALLINNATNLSCRAYEVQRDPAVQKAWSEATRDVAKAARSVAEAGYETRSAWRRADAGGAAGLMRRLA